MPNIEANIGLIRSNSSTIAVHIVGTLKLIAELCSTSAGMIAGMRTGPGP